ERDGVVHLPVHEEILAGCLQLQRLGAGSGREDRVEVRRVVRIRAEDEQAKRALVLDERAVQAATEVRVALGASRGDEWARAGEGIVTGADAREVADRSDTRLRDDLDRHAARAVVLGGELIA